MNKELKMFLAGLVLILILVSLLAIFPNITVHSKNRIKSIEVHVVLNDDGSANITQIWETDTKSGTEFYIPMNIYEMEILDFKVKDETGREFTFVEYWSRNDTLKEKAYKNGFNRPIGSRYGIELCWGKGSHGEHTYTITYKLTNFLNSYEDKDGFYSMLINYGMSPLPEKAKVTISLANGKMDFEKIYARSFGSDSFSNGNYFEDTGDGKLEFVTNNKFDKNTHLRVLFGIDKGELNPTSNKDMWFEARIFHAELDEREEFMEAERLRRKKFNEIFGVGLIILNVVGAIIKVSLSPSKSSEINVAEILSEQMSNYGTRKIEYFKDLPMNNSFEATIFGMKVNNILSNEKIFLAYILQLIKDGAIIPVKREAGGFFDIGMKFDFDQKGIFSADNTVFFELDMDYKSDDALKQKLYDMIKNAAQDDELEIIELESWVRDNIDLVDEFAKECLQVGENIFKEMRGFELKEDENGRKIVELTGKGREYLDEIEGFRKYMKKFEYEAQKDIEEIEILDRYVIYSTLFGFNYGVYGVARKIYELYPEFKAKSGFAKGEYDVLNVIGFADTLTTEVTSGYRPRRFLHAGRGGFGGGGFSGGGFGGGLR